MDAAVRSYESGYELLLGTDVLETIASWSPRWNEARLLADVFAIRILRCLLWNGNSTAAVRRWQSHRERIRDFVDRRGKGSATYGWEAWEARWATVMAELVKKASFLEFAGFPLYLPAEKTIPIGERMLPWDYLHHPGYWYRLATRHLMARRILALSIPEEDRSPPGSSPASAIASKAYTYDTFLCPEPHDENPLPGHEGVDHSALIVDSINKTISEFQQKGQSRFVQDLQLLSANENMKRGAWDDALKILRPLWQKMSYRKEGWWNAVEEISWALRKAAVQAGDGGSIIAVDWEMMNRNFTHHLSWHYDLTKSLQGLESIKAKPTVVLHEKEVNSFLTVTYAFEFSEGKVGELCSSQLVVKSSAMPTAAPITMAEIRLSFEETLKPLILRHKPVAEEPSETPKNIYWTKVPLSEDSQEGKATLVGETSLTFQPGQTRVFESSTILREAGEGTAVSATFFMNTELFDLEYVHTFEPTNTTPDVWWGERAVKRRLVRLNTASITVLPKPPKLELRFLGLREQYYANEQIILQLEVLNEEDADAIVNLEARTLGDGAPPVELKISPSSPAIEEGQSGDDSVGTPLGRIASAASTIVELRIPPMDLPAVYDISMKATYNLVTDLQIAINRPMTMQLEVINPFEANYDFSPRIHPDPWPSLFTHVEGADDGTEVQAHGLSQKWCLTARYASFAVDELIVEDVDIRILGMNGGIQCYTKNFTTIPDEGLRVAPKSLEEAQFEVFTQKISLDDRGTATLDVSLAIHWRRAGDDTTINTTVLGVPRLLVASTEPRVLAAVSYSTKIPSDDPLRCHDRESFEPLPDLWHHHGAQREVCVLWGEAIYSAACPTFEEDDEVPIAA